MCQKSMRIEGHVSAVQGFKLARYFRNVFEGVGVPLPPPISAVVETSEREFITLPSLLQFGAWTSGFLRDHENVHTTPYSSFMKA